MLREEGGFHYKKAIVDTLLIIIGKVPEAKEAGLAHEVVVVNDGDGSAAAAAAAAAASHYEDGDEAATTESLDARVRERAQGIAEQWVALGTVHRGWARPREGGTGAPRCVP